MPFPVAEEFIAETERKLGVSFPNSFRARMSRKNGGEFSTDNDDWQLYPFFDTSDRKRLSRTVQRHRARDWHSAAVAWFSTRGGRHRRGDLLVFLPVAGSTMLQPQPFLWLHETGELQPTDISFDDAN